MALVTQAEAARILGVSAPAIHQAVRHGRLRIVLDTKGNKRIVSGSFSTKLPSRSGLISAAKAVSVTANIAIAKIEIIKIMGV